MLVYASPTSLGLMFALSSRNVAVPGDIVVSGDQRMAEAMQVSGIPTIDVVGSDIARSAMDLLTGLLAGTTPERSHEQVRLPVPVHWS